MSSIESVAAVLAAKFGGAKTLALFAALLGAALMVCFRVPKSRKEMGLQFLVAMGCSFMFGPMAVKLVAYWLPFIGVDIILVPVHGFIGAMSWGIFGALAHFRDKLSTDPKGAIQDVKDII